MSKKLINTSTKACILLALIYLLMSQNKGDIVYIYANF
jgi:hypothetical protein